MWAEGDVVHFNVIDVHIAAGTHRNSESDVSASASVVVGINFKQFPCGSGRRSDILTYLLEVVTAPTVWMSVT